MIITYCLFPKNLLQKYQIKIYEIKELLFAFKCFPLLLSSKIWWNEHEIQVTLEYSIENNNESIIFLFLMWDVEDVIFWGCRMFWMSYVLNVWCFGCEIFEMWDVWDVECSGCGMFKIWDVRDVGCLPRCKMLIYKMSFFHSKLRFVFIYKFVYQQD